MTLMARWKVAVVLGLSLTVFAPSARGGDDQPHSPKQARAWAALQREFETTASKQEAELRAHAARILTALRRWEIEPLVEECMMYGGPQRRELTRKHLEAHKAELQAAAALADLEAPDFARELDFESPEPAAGMTAQVHIPFGPRAKPPAGPRRTPSRHELELWWSGPLMPEANGPVHETPPAGSKRGRWRFHTLTLPYTITPSLRL